MICDAFALTARICDAMKQQARDAGVQGVEVDISGGVDSAVVAALSVRAFGPERVIGVHTRIETDIAATKRARLVAEKFGFPMLELDLTAVFRSLVDQIGHEAGLRNLDASRVLDKKRRGSLKSCLRAPIGRFVSQCWGGLRQGTGNRDEDNLLRFYQKGGDGEVDCNWIACLYKSEVWQLAEYLGVPQEVIDAVPSPDLTGVYQTDESELEEATGTKLTYGGRGPDDPVGSIEMVDRLDADFGVVTGSLSHLTRIELLQIPPFEKCVDEILAIRKMEKITRHKSVPPPMLSRKDLVRDDILE